MAWVSAVNGNTITIEEYNERYNGTYDSRPVTLPGGFEFIHFKDLPTNPPPQPAPSPSQVASPPVQSTQGAGSPQGAGGLSVQPAAGASSLQGGSGLSVQPAAGSQTVQNPAPAPAGSGAGSPATPRPPAPTITSTTAAPRPSPPAPQTWSEQEGHCANTFSDPYNASGMGQKIPAGAYVQVTCKVYAPQIQNANPDGYWYRIASSPWNNA